MTPRTKNNLIAIALIIAGAYLSDTSMSLPALPKFFPSQEAKRSLTDWQKSVRASMPKADGRQLGLVAGEFARQIEFDGSLAEPRVSDTSVAIGFLKDMNEYAFQGRKLATDEYRELIKKEFDARFQADGKGKDLTPEVRQQLVQFYREIHYALDF